jgi:hypothetical protein
MLQECQIVILFPKLRSAALLTCMTIILSGNYWLSVPVGPTIVTEYGAATAIITNHCSFLSFSCLSHDRSKSLYQSQLFTQRDLELPPSDESILSCP